jgi:hypothetical protein
MATPRSTIYEKLAEDLDLLAQQYQRRPNAVVVTGDVAEWSTPEEYAAAERFLERLAVKTKIDRQHVVVVPGNHDVHWKLCQGARLIAEGTGEPFEEPYFAKFGNYQRFFQRFYKDVELLFDEDRLFQVFPFPEHKLLYHNYTYRPLARSGGQLIYQPPFRLTVWPVM